MPAAYCPSGIRPPSSPACIPIPTPRPESVFIDDLLKNIVAARECGLHAIQFRDPESCRAEMRAYLPDAGL